MAVMDVVTLGVTDPAAARFLESRGAFTGPDAFVREPSSASAG